MLRPCQAVWRYLGQARELSPAGEHDASRARRWSFESTAPIVAECRLVASTSTAALWHAGHA